MSYLGSWAIDNVLTFPAITHRFDTGALTDADSVPSYRVYEDETSTAILTGSMAKLDDTNTTGFYSEQITLSAANGFEKGKCYTIYITAAVNSVTGGSFHTFQIEAEVDANTVSGGVNVTQFGGSNGTFSSGRPEVNTSHWAGAATATNDVALATAPTNFASFSIDADGRVDVIKVAGTTQTAGDIIGDTNDIQSRLPAALVSGRIDASVGAMATGVLTATAIAADAITDAKVASDVTIASVTGSVGSIATGGITSGSFAAGAIDAAAIAADAIGSSELAASAVTEIQSGLSTLDAAGVRSAVGLASANLDTQLGDLPTANENADALLDRSAGVETNRTLRQALRLMLAVLCGKASGMATTTAVFRDTNDTVNRVSATVDSSGNRSAVTLDAS